MQQEQKLEQENIEQETIEVELEDKKKRYRNTRA